MAIWFLQKFWQTVLISLQKHMAYKINFFLMMIGPALVYLFIQYNLWTAVYSLKEGMSIQGYDLHQMLQYNFWVFVVQIVGKGHNSMDLALDIRFGRISAYLLYPFGLWYFQLASFCAFQMIQIVVSMSTMAFFVATGLLEFVSALALLKGLAFAMLVSFTWFNLQFIIGVMGFWLEETWVLRVILMTVTAFLSGAVLPLEIFPEWFVAVLDYTPFPLLTYVPVKYFMDQAVMGFGLAMAVLLAWNTLILAVGGFVWSRGLRLYTAAGI